MTRLSYQQRHADIQTEYQSYQRLSNARPPHFTWVNPTRGTLSNQDAESKEHSPILPADLLHSMGHVTKRLSHGRL